LIRDTLAEAVLATLSTLEVDPLPDVVALERPARREHGDWSTNVALATAKKAGRNPRELAGQIAESLNADLPPHVASVEIAGPGFINFHLHESWLHELLAEVISQGEDGFARSGAGGGTKVLVEFVSANPTGPVHAGHGRGAAYGDSLARVLARAGYEVGREFYVNDRGSQMLKFAASLVARKEGKEPPEDGYQGQYIIDWAKEMPDDVDPLEWGRERALADQREVLAAFDVSFDSFFSEREMVESGAIEVTLADLAEHGATYEDDGATWLRSTDYGDDKDRVLVKSDGEYTYLLPDIAYHRDKLARGWQVLVNVLGADHHGYTARMSAALQALGHDKSVFDPELTQMVKLMEGGQEVRLSKRTGDIIELRDVIDEVGADSARLTYLLQAIDSPQTFDLDLVRTQAMENPVFYVQYANARIHSMVRTAAERGVERLPLADVDLSVLVHEREVELLRSLSELPDVVEGAAFHRAPHQVATWVRELAGRFHGFYHDCRVLDDDISPELTQARLWLIEGARTGLAIGLGLLGVTAPESM
jgi:arginyl-tRNA synthetase